jgi:diaminopimelate epimerase
MRFYKYHALGNDYIVLDPSESGGRLSQEQIRVLCHRNFGVGSDGILYGPIPTEQADFALRIFNPDGSEAEKSGNGLRIFARYLRDYNKTKQEQFSILTPGGCVRVRIHNEARQVAVDMGRVSFDSTEIPVTGPQRQVINETMQIDGEDLKYCAATIGYPHCVILRENISEAEARRLGPGIEQDPRFPNRTNVQFVQILGRRNIRIEIWERGAGYTLASGSSSCAAAAAARKLGLCDFDMTVQMPGGKLDVTVSDDFEVRMTGPVTKVAEGVVFEEIFD